MLSRLCASQTKPGKQVGAGASSSASAASQAKDPRRDDVAFASFSAVQSPPLFARLRPVDRAFPRTRVALVSRSARPRVQVEPRETTEWRARRIIRATPRSECSLLFFSHLLQAPLSSSTPSLSCCIHLRRAGCGRSGPQQRLRADTVREIAWRRRGFDEEKGAARGSRPREIGKKEKKSEKRAAETSFPVGRSFDRQSPFFPGRVFFFHFFFLLFFRRHNKSSGALQYLCCSPCLPQACSRPRRRRGPGILLQQEQEEQLSLLVRLLSSRPPPRPRRPSFLSLVAAESAPPPHRRRRRATVRFLLNSRLWSHKIDRDLTIHTKGWRAAAQHRGAFDRIRFFFFFSPTSASLPTTKKLQPRL